MRPEDERSFTADDPVAQYWLHNCVGFRVRGLRSGTGVVRDIDSDDGGVATLAVSRRGLLRGTAHVSTARVERVDPWDETIVLRSGGPEARDRRVAQARGAAALVATEAHGAAGLVATAARGAAIAVAFGARLFLSAVARFLLALATLARKHAPGARDRVRHVWLTLAALARAYPAAARRAYRAQKDAVAAWQAERKRGAWGDESPPTLAALPRAYAAEARRAYRAQKEAVAAWQAERKRGEWGDESPPTRAGADEVDARSEEQIRS